jgi:hypothetical protein
MRSVADDLRRDTVKRVLAMPLAERIALALALGDEDLARYMRTSGLDRATAMRELSARRQDGRAPSCAAPPTR